MLADRYRKSIEHLERAEARIPLGSQTFTKSRMQLPLGAFPLYADRASGAYVWDVDGNRYVDLMSCLGAVILGHSDPVVRSAVEKQLDSGVLFSLPHSIELEVADLLHELIPCADQTRFAKNGTDVTTAAIRLSRAVTGRDHVVMCGYHGWQDWSIGTTTMSQGVPDTVRSLTTSIPFNDVSAMESAFSRLDGKVACLIMEPMTSVFPDEGFLQYARDICTRNGSVLVFDEMLTGLRFAPGGAQEYFGITPDLATFGKAISNGFPLAALCGSSDLMNHVPEIFFSGTHGGEALSLAAASVVLTMTLEGQVSSPLADIGQSLTDDIQASLSTRAGDLLTFVGHPSWRFQKWNGLSEHDLPFAKTLLLQELARRGVLVLGVHDVTLCHQERERAIVAQAYAEALEVVADAAASSSWDEALHCEPIRPLFQTRPD